MATIVKVFHFMDVLRSSGSPFDVLVLRCSESILYLRLHLFGIFSCIIIRLRSLQAVSSLLFLTQYQALHCMASDK